MPLPPDTPAARADLSQSSSTSVAAVASLAAKSLACPAVLSVPARHIVAFAPNSLSDVLFCLPALSALRESFPGAQISCVSRSSLAPVVRASRLVDEVLERPRGGLSAQAGLMLKLHALRPDIAVAFSPTRNTVLMAWSSGAPVRAGFEEAKMEALLTHRVKRNGPPRIEAFLELTRELGCKTPHLDYCGLLDVGADAVQQAQRLLDESGVEGRFVLAAPDSGAPGDARRITSRASQSHSQSRAPEMLKRALPALSSCWPTVLIGAPSPRLVADLASSSEHRIVDLGGRAGLLVQAALCSKAALLVAPESGLLHLASAMHTPVVGIYHEPGATKTEPRGPRRILHAGPELEPEQVLAAAQDLIGL